MNNRLFPFLSLFFLGACASAGDREPIVVTETVEVPVPVRCEVEVPNFTPPDTKRAVQSQPDTFSKVKMLLAGRTARDGYIGELQALIDACSAQIR